ncbi:MAG: PLP-dependent transferase [Burkholderiaceae bacterium]
MTEPRRLSTALIHHPYQPPQGFAAPQAAVHKASTVLFRDVATLRQRNWKDKTGYTYGLHGTPTTFTLEERIATLEGGLQTLLLPSGLAAIALVDMALLRSGDEVLIPDNAYGPGKEFARNELASWGISNRLYDPADPQRLAEMISPATRLVWLEAPGSVTMEFPDLAGLIAAAKSRGIVCAIDNTWGAGVAFNAFVIADGTRTAIGADVVMQALTKYPSGGGDVTMGSVTTRDPALHGRLKATHMRMGWGIGANDAELLLRSLPSLDLRYAMQDASARHIAQWLRSRPEIAQVLHPALAGSPGHEHWRGISSRAAGLFSVVFHDRHANEQVDAFVEGLKLFKLGYSWAGPISLVVPYSLAGLRNAPKWTGALVRFSIGLEAPDDLMADLEASLERVFASNDS